MRSYPDKTQKKKNGTNVTAGTLYKRFTTKPGFVYW